MRALTRWTVAVLVAALTLAACDSEDTLHPVPLPTAGAGGTPGGTGGSGGQGGEPLEPPPAFDRFCAGQTWDQTLQAGTAGELSGSYLGVLDPDPPFPAGTLETMKLIPEHPFYVTTVRVAFGAGSGPARLRLMTAFGRSYPGGWPDIESPEANLLPPIELDVAESEDEEPAWIEVDVAAAGVFLEPTQHYLLVYEHLAAEPRLAVEDLPTGEVSRALIHLPSENVPYGLGDANYRMELRGQFFCSWAEADRWFGEDTAAPFANDASNRVSVADLNGDGHEDVIVNAGGPLAYFGDGTGQFAAPGFDPFPDVPQANMLVFGDLDNDGDRDAFASHRLELDGDGDNVTIVDGDCNDADAAVHPTATEVDNGYDDDCDGVADDGLDTSDSDGDGVDIASGDCDDTRDDVYPLAPELLDRRDNDCNLQVDEIFVNRILLNDGTGSFSAVPTAGVEALDITAAAAWGDGNGDGFLDVYWGNWLLHYPTGPATADRYFEGNGDGTFVDAYVAAGMDIGSPRGCYGVLWTDFNNDGYPDIWVGNYSNSTHNVLFENQGDGTFANVAPLKGVDHDGIGFDGGTTFGGDWGDFDNDGDVDLYAAHISHPRNRPTSDASTLLVNSGAPDFEFADQREALGLVYDEGDINAAFADFDNDMDLDLVVGSTYPTHFSRLYRNDGAAGFVDVSYEAHTAVQSGASVAWSDVDEDGDPDLLVADGSGAPYVHLFINRVGQDNHWVQLDLVGTATNRDAVGARVTLTAGGVTQIRDVSGGGGHTAQQQSRIVHFGLGSHTTIDSVSVRWVGGSTEPISGVAVDGRYRVIEGTGQGELVP